MIGPPSHLRPQVFATAVWIWLVNMTIPASPQAQDLKFELLGAKPPPSRLFARDLVGKIAIRAAHLLITISTFSTPDLLGGTSSSEHLEDHRSL